VISHVRDVPDLDWAFGVKCLTTSASFVGVQAEGSEIQTSMNGVVGFGIKSSCSNSLGLA